MSSTVDFCKSYDRRSENFFEESPQPKI